MKEWSEMNQNPEEKPERRTFGEFVKDHKKQIIIAATATGFVIVCGVIFKKKDAIKTFCTGNVAHAIAENSDNICLIPSPPTEDNIMPEYLISNVKGFIRNLPTGQKASPGKIELASRLGIELGKNQTLVDPFSRRIKITPYAA